MRFKDNSLLQVSNILNPFRDRSTEWLRVNDVGFVVLLDHLGDFASSRNATLSLSINGEH
jgi:hypothetical protein